MKTIDERELQKTCKPKSAKHSRYKPHLFKRGSDAEKPVKGM